MNPHRLTWGFAYNMPFAAVLGVTTLIALFFSKESKRIPINALVIVWFLWIFWMNFTTLFALVPEDAYMKWERSIKIQLMVIVTMMVIKSPERIKLLVWVIALSIGFFGIKGGIFTLLTGASMLVWGPPGTYFSGNNGLAAALIMVLPLFYFLYLHTKNKWLRYAILVSMPLMGLSILASYSRGAFLALAAIVLYWSFKSKRKLVVIPMLTLVGAISLSIMPGKWFDRVETIQSYEEDGSALGRINAWYFAFNLANHRPIVGGGFSTFDRQLFYKYAPEPENFHDSHSIYFEVLGEQGYIGLFLFLCLGWLSLRHANKIKKITEGKDGYSWAYDLSSMVQVGLIGYAVAGAFLGLAYFDLYYHLIALLVLTKAEVDKEETEYSQASKNSIQKDIGTLN